MERALPNRQRLVHGDEPLRGVAEDDGLLGAPGVRVLVLHASARDQHPGFDERRNDGVVGIAFVALVVDDALAFQPRHVPGEAAVAVDRERDGGVDSALPELGGVLHPDLEVLPAVPRRGVHEARAVLFRDVAAIEEGHLEVVAEAAQGMDTLHPGQLETVDGVVPPFVGFDLGSLHHPVGELRRQHELVAGLGPIALRRRGHLIEAVLDLR